MPTIVIGDAILVEPSNAELDAALTKAGYALDPDADLDGPAADALAHELLQVGLERAVGVGDLRGDLQVAVVDRADFHRDGPVRVLVTRFAESGHAEQQGNLFERERGRRGDPRGGRRSARPVRSLGRRGRGRGRRRGVAGRQREVARLGKRRDLPVGRR